MSELSLQKICLLSGIIIILLIYFFIELFFLLFSGLLFKMISWLILMINSPNNWNWNFNTLIVMLGAPIIIVGSVILIIILGRQMRPMSEKFGLIVKSLLSNRMAKINEEEFRKEKSFIKYESFYGKDIRSIVSNFGVILIIGFYLSVMKIDTIVELFLKTPIEHIILLNIILLIGLKL